MWQTAFSTVTQASCRAPLIQDHQAHFSLSTSGVSDRRENHVDFLQVESPGERRFDSKESWHLVRQLKCGFREQWVPLISQLPLVFTPGKWRNIVERGSVSPGCESCWVPPFCTLPRCIWEKMSGSFGEEKKYRCKPLLWKTHTPSLSALDSYGT